MGNLRDRRSATIVQTQRRTAAKAANQDHMWLNRTLVALFISIQQNRAEQNRTEDLFCSVHTLT